MAAKRYPGIDVRHAKACASRTDHACDCTPTYQAHVYDARTSRRIRKTFPRVAEAVAWRKDAEHAIKHRTADARKLGVVKREPSITVAAALTALLAGMDGGSVRDRSGKPYKPATRRSYSQAVHRYLVPAFGPMRLTDLRRRDVQDLIERMHAEGLSPSTIRNKLDPLRVLYRRALRDDLVTVDPTDGLELPALQRSRRGIASPERAQALIDALPEGERALWATAFYAGLRRGELRALRWRHVDFDTGVVRVESGWDDVEGEQEAKSEAGRRTVPLVGALRRHLATLKLASGRTDADLVFGRTAGAPFTPSTIRRRALDAWKAAELDALTPHEARHTCASYLIAAGLNAKQLSVYIGHTDIRTTFNIYGHLMPGDVEQAVTQIDAFLDQGATA